MPGLCYLEDTGVTCVSTEEEGLFISPKTQLTMPVDCCVSPLWSVLTILS